MLKKITLTIAVFLFFTLGLAGFVYQNLTHNCVYYAKHTPHSDGTDPVLIMLVDHIADIYTPELDGIGYDFDGPDAILFYDENDKQTGFIMPTEYGYLYEDNGTGYDFDHSFRIMKAFNSTEWIDIDMSTVNEKK